MFRATVVKTTCLANASKTAAVWCVALTPRRRYRAGWTSTSDRGKAPVMTPDALINKCLSGPGQLHKAWQDRRLGGQRGFASRTTGHPDATVRAEPPAWVLRWLPANMCGLRSKSPRGIGYYNINLNSGEIPNWIINIPSCFLIASVLIDPVYWALHCKKDFSHFRLNWIFPRL